MTVRSFKKVKQILYGFPVLQSYHSIWFEHFEHIIKYINIDS